MTPRETTIMVLQHAKASGQMLLTRRQSHETVAEHLGREQGMFRAAIDWARSMPASVTLEEAFSGQLTIHDMTQLVCGQLPEGWIMRVEMENGAGWITLENPEGDEIVDTSKWPDTTMEGHIVELVKLAKGEPNEYDRELP